MPGIYRTLGSVASTHKCGIPPTVLAVRGSGKQKATLKPVCILNLRQERPSQTEGHLRLGLWVASGRKEVFDFQKEEACRCCLLSEVSR